MSKKKKGKPQYKRLLESYVSDIPEDLVFPSHYAARLFLLPVVGWGFLQEKDEEGYSVSVVPLYVNPPLSLEEGDRLVSVLPAPPDLYHAMVLVHCRETGSPVKDFDLGFIEIKDASRAKVTEVIGELAGEICRLGEQEFTYDQCPVCGGGKDPSGKCSVTTPFSPNLDWLKKN